jgi:uncharacterized protein YrrD
MSSDIIQAKQLIGKKIVIKKQRKWLLKVVDVVYNRIMKQLVCLIANDNNGKELVVPMRAVRDIKTKTIIIDTQDHVLVPATYSRTIAQMLKQRNQVIQNLAINNS